MIEPRTGVYRSHALTLSDAVDLMAFAVVARTKLPWPEDEIEPVEVRYLSPLIPGGSPDSTSTTAINAEPRYVRARVTRTRESTP